MTSVSAKRTRMFQPSTGYAALDALRFTQAPKVEARRHDDSDIIFSRGANYGRAGTMTRVERDANQPDILCIGPGSGTAAECAIAGARFRVKPSRKVRTIFVPHGADSWLNFSAGACSTNFIFPKDYLVGFLAETDHQSLAPVCYSEDPRFHQITRLLEAEITGPGFATRLMIDGLCRALAALIVGINTEAIDQESDRIHLSPSRTRRVLAYIDANLDHDITVADMATVAELSPFHFARVFKRATGLSPYQYVRERRLAMSRKLLTDSGLSIAELALICGFANQSHFTAAFSKAMDMPPARYRQTSTA